MGGNALLVDTKRLNVSDFNAIKFEVISKLKSLFPKIIATKCYHTKSSFGDLDLLVPYSIPDNFSDILIKLFNTKSIFINSSVISFEYKDFQIDLIFINEYDFISSEFYYSYNDLGNLLGNLYKQFGLRFGHDGLTYIYNTNNTSYKFNISKNPEMMLRFLGLSYFRYLDGYEKLTDIFDYVISSKYFNKKAFDYNNNHKSRTRLKKRTTHKEFLAYINEFDDKTIESKIDLDYIDYFFSSDIRAKIDDINDLIELDTIIKYKYNGNIISKLIPELKKVKLSDFMKAFEKTLGNKKEWVLSKASNEIEKEIITFYNIWKNI